MQGFRRRRHRSSSVLPSPSSSVSITLLSINITATNALVNVHLGEYEGQEDKTELTQEIMESITLLNSRSKFSVAKCVAETTSSADIQEALREESFCKATSMLSCSSPGMSFAKSNQGIQNERLLSAEPSCCTLQLNLGTGPIEDPHQTKFTYILPS